MDNNRICRLRECCALVGLSPSSVYRLEKTGAFPQRVRLSKNCVGFRYSELLAWVASRQAAVAVKEVSAANN